MSWLAIIARASSTDAKPHVKVMDEISGTHKYGNSRVEGDHGRLKARLRPMRGLKQDCSAGVIIAPGMPSSRTFGAAITSWLLRSRRPAAGRRVRRTGVAI